MQYHLSIKFINNANAKSWKKTTWLMICQQKKITPTHKFKSFYVATINYGYFLVHDFKTYKTHKRMADFSG